MSSTLQLVLNPPLPNVSCHIRYDQPPTWTGSEVDGDWDERSTNKDGWVGFMFVEPRPVYVLIRGAGYRDLLLGRVDMPHDETITVDLQRLPLAPVKLDGVRLDPFLRGSTDFLLYKRYLDGEDITPILQQRSSLGCNMVRVFGMVNSFAKWHPADYPAYYDGLIPFCKLAADYGLYVYFTVFADTQEVIPDPAGQLAHFNLVVDRLKEAPNGLLELVNEQGQHTNSVEQDRFPKPVGVLASRGSYGGDIPPPGPYWDFTDFHARRDYPSAIKDMCVLELREGWEGGGGFEGTGQIPILQGEPQGFGPNPKRWQSPLRASGLAGTARGTACGVVFHSDQGILSQMWDGITLDCAKAFYEALK